MGRRYRVQSRTMDFTSVNNTLVPSLSVHALASSKIHRCMQATCIRSEDGKQITGRRTMTAIERMAIDNELGLDGPLLLVAAAWFAERGTVAGLRTTLAYSPLAQVFAPDPRRSAAREELGRLHRAIGGRAFNLLLDTCVFELPLAEVNKPWVREALRAVSRWRHTGGRVPEATCLDNAHKKTPDGGTVGG